jgi:hypothetical protein
MPEMENWPEFIKQHFETVPFIRFFGATSSKPPAAMPDSHSA